MVNRSYSKVLLVAMFGTVKKFSKFVLVYKNDIIFIGSVTTCGFILQRICQEYLNNQKKLYSIQELKNSKPKSRKKMRRILNFIARKGGMTMFFVALVGKASPKVIALKAFSEGIYKSLPYTFSDAEKKRWVIEVAKNKSSYKKIRFFIKLLSYVSGITGFSLFSLLFLDEALSRIPGLSSYILNILTFFQILMGIIPDNLSQEWVELIILWKFFTYS